MISFQDSRYFSGDETIIPQRDTIFKVNDLVYVIARKEAVSEVMSYSVRRRSIYVELPFSEAEK